MNSFVSVATSAARYQDISLNPQKLAGQCAKLKCCLNYEVDDYVESIKRLPAKEVHLETTTGTYYFFKRDVFKREITYSTDKNIPANLVTISAERAFEIIALNKNGVKPDDLKLESEADKAAIKEFGDIVGQDSVTRFDKNKKKKKKGKKPGNNTQRPPKEGGEGNITATGEQPENSEKNGNNRGNQRGNRRPNNRNQNRPPRQNRNRPPKEGAKQGNEDK